MRGAAGSAEQFLKQLFVRGRSPWLFLAPPISAEFKDLILTVAAKSVAPSHLQVTDVGAAGALWPQRLVRPMTYKARQAVLSPP
ncbi:hypothetical protein ABH926_007272 [Catenulispora sp. GP43]